MDKKTTSRILLLVLLLPSVGLTKNMDIEKDALKSCWAYNRIKHMISETRDTKNSGKIRLRKGYSYRIIESRDDINELRIEIDYIPQGSVRHRWVDRDCFYKNNISVITKEQKGKKCHLSKIALQS